MIILVYFLITLGLLAYALRSTKHINITHTLEGSTLVNFCASIHRTTAYDIFKQAFIADNRFETHADIAYDKFLLNHAVPVFVENYARGLVRKEQNYYEVK